VRTWEYPEIGPDFAVGRCEDLNLLLWLSMGEDPRSEFAFTRFVELTENDVLRYFAKRTGGNEADACELRQDTYLSVYTHRKKCRPDEARTFLFLTARNHFCRWYKTRKRRLESASSEPPDSETPGPDASPDLEQDARLDLEQAKKRLTAHHAQVIALRYDEGLNQTEIAERLRVSKQTVSRHLQQALKDLKRHMGS
jgi:RNA polymerase sigma-70 factor (ECF subfamily)